MEKLTGVRRGAGSDGGFSRADGGRGGSRDGKRGGSRDGERGGVDGFFYPDFRFLILAW
uniref:Uncharacterized protein n=2 Tax=Oryza sativa subsp. japonica TaxID=39947 RepID=Q53M37_ORYSJ|nr:hypothetical protein LOC_Os11g14370 [Oryza sativa Japonica Group]AAX96748.1 hypothetical protein [Oryza sativa Japonica Group]ABA92369.1 hypothetical protein LOC_Os11g14370 [Oryza sativa Japonica Group]